MSPTRRRTLLGLGGLLGTTAVAVPVGRSLARPRDGQAPFEVSPRWSRGWHAGINHAHVHHPGVGYGSESSLLELRRLRDLGFTHVFLTPFAYQPSLTGPELRFGSNLDRTLTDDALLREAEQARKLGLEIGMKPHVWANEFWGGGKSRQDIDMGKAEVWAQWFDQMGAFAAHYAALSEKMGASLMCVGLEYTTATRRNPGRWAEVAERCRAVFSGKLTYAANWWEELESFADWEAFDFIGVNAYYPLSEAVDPTTEALVRAWRPHVQRIGRISAANDRPVLITEAGLRAVKGAAARPWDQGHAGEPDAALQARAFEALLAAFSDESWFSGVYWWKSFTDGGDHEGDDYAIGDPAEAVLRKWWG